jgi:hypothetical protein
MTSAATSVEVATATSSTANSGCSPAITAAAETRHSETAPSSQRVRRALDVSWSGN